MSVHFHLMTQRQNRIEFFGHDADLIAPSALGLDEDLLSDEGGVHWSQAFVGPLGLDAEQATSSEGHLWSSDDHNAKFKLDFIIAQMVTAIANVSPAADYYASRPHFAKMISLLMAARMYALIHHDRKFVISWF